MLVCATCKKEMTCIKTGMCVRYSETATHAYRGDKFECPSCKVQMVVCNAVPYEDKSFQPEDVFMDVSGVEEAKKNLGSVNVVVIPEPLRLGAIKR